MGSNLGDRCAHIQGGLDAIGMIDATAVVCCSTIIETAPVGPGKQGNYLNAVAKITTRLKAGELLAELLAIESRFGRDRSIEERWGARTLDLDILLFGDEIIDLPGLCVPHPRIHERSFVLIPLSEIAADLVLPGYQKTPQELLEAIENED